MVDAAVCKRIRLSGGSLVFCEDPETEKRLRDFLERVPAGRGQYGINAFLEQYLESLLILSLIHISPSGTGAASLGGSKKSYTKP